MLHFDRLIKRGLNDDSYEVLTLEEGLVSLAGAIQKRSFFYWLTIIFNRVDESRIKEVGPDRACAEWLIKNGASVKWKGSKDYLKNYDKLMKTSNEFFIHAVDGTDSGISHIGFPYFEGCKHIEDIRFINCRYINDQAIPLLHTLQESLQYLEIRNCKSITDEGLQHIKHLKNLKVLKISELPYINPAESIHQLRNTLPNCKIQLE